MSTVAVPEPTVEAAAVSNPGERVSNPGERVSSVGERVSSVGERVSNPGERVSNPGERVSSVGERVSSVGESFHSCWSCRLLSGGGLIAGGLYVLRAAKSVMRTGAPPSIGLAMQITFAASLGAWGVVVIADPVGKAKKSPDT